MDTVWLDQRLEHLDYELPYDYKESSDSNVRFLILGEADHISRMVQKAPGRIPRVTDMWHFEPTHLTAKRTFFGRFIEHQPVANTPARVFPTPLGLRRPASPSSPASASRRRRYETGSPGVQVGVEGEENAGNET